MTSENQAVDSAVVQQLEYYFGNINLPRDKFMQENMKLDEGWITIETLLTFNRLANITKDPEVIAKAVKEANSEIISISEDGQKIRRNLGNPLPEDPLEYWQKLKCMTVYMKRFAPETTLDQIMEFAKQFGHVDHVVMRRTKPDRQFKGSVFITYKTREEAEAAQKSDAKFGDIELVKMMKRDYWLAKDKEAKEKRASKKAEEIAEKSAKNKDQFTKGLILAVEGFEAGATYNEIKEFFKQYGSVAYVVHEDDSVTAKIRFNGRENSARTAWDAAVAAGSDGKVLFKEKELTAKVMEGEEEEKYWNEYNPKKRSIKERRGRRVFRRRDRKRRTPFPDGDAPKAKRTVFADED